ncbi:hypothetical protein [Pseudomonas sp. EL_65y_Pfl1_R83]|uniref:hypothetical protein n=1 Tax=Pseudomonas sp. EL_65y_Pfl1_R83 TaxID=3088697 RepID=UPI0030DC0CD3
MINLHRLINRLFPDRRPDWEQKREREFILAANSLKTLKVTPGGGMSIDPEELREQIVVSREQLKHLVHKPGAASGSFEAAADIRVEQEASATIECAFHAIRPPSPPTSGHPFHAHPARQSERSDAGLHC